MNLQQMTESLMAINVMAQALSAQNITLTDDQMIYAGLSMAASPILTRFVTGGEHDRLLAEFDRMTKEVREYLILVTASKPEASS